MSGEVSDERFVPAVQRSVERELRRLGPGGVLRREGRWLILGKGASQTRAEVQGTFEQWQGLPDDLRERRARQLAELLLQQPVHASVAAPRQRLSNRPGWLSVVAPVVVLAAMVAAVLLAFRVLSPTGGTSWASLSAWFHAPPDRPVPALRPADPDRERAVLAQSACDQARARIARGANVGPIDVEGWQVELVLFRRGTASDLSAASALNGFLRRKPNSSASTVVWPHAKSLLLDPRFDALVDVRALPPLGASQLSGLRLLFSGPYVAPYFTEEQRADYVLFADALATALSATDGALYAHCENSGAHYIGSWFLGKTPGAALNALVYFMAGSNDIPILNPELTADAPGAPRSTHLFDAIGKASASLDRGATATLIGREQGMISGRPNQPTRLTFPFRDANRAQRASVEVARALGLAQPG